MLGGRAQRPARIAQHGGELGRATARTSARISSVGPAVEAGAEDDAGVGVGRMQRQRRRQAGMDADR
jgi:hypothetical protein